MEFRFYAILIINILSTGLLLAIYDGIILRRVIKNNNFSSDLKKDKHIDEYGSNEIEDIIPQYQIERMRREEEFDKRISNMKAELEYYNSGLMGTTAEILEKGIYNLPHDVIIPDDMDYEEYVE